MTRSSSARSAGDIWTIMNVVPLRSVRPALTTWLAYLIRGGAAGTQLLSHIHTPAGRQEGGRAVPLGAPENHGQFRFSTGTNSSAAQLTIVGPTGTGPAHR